MRSPQSLLSADGIPWIGIARNLRQDWDPFPGIECSFTGCLEEESDQQPDVQKYDGGGCCLSTSCWNSLVAYRAEIVQGFSGDVSTSEA